MVAGNSGGSLSALAGETQVLDDDGHSSDTSPSSGDPPLAGDTQPLDDDVSFSLAPGPADWGTTQLLDDRDGDPSAEMTLELSGSDRDGGADDAVSVPCGEEKDGNAGVAVDSDVSTEDESEPAKRSTSEVRTCLQSSGVSAHRGVIHRRNSQFELSFSRGELKERDIDPHSATEAVEVVRQPDGYKHDDNLQTKSWGQKKNNGADNSHRVTEDHKRDEASSRSSNPIARKLFDEVRPDIVDATCSDVKTHEEMDSPFSRLSYVTSQEPGELSQANALDVVDKFLSINDTGLSQHVDPGKLYTVRSPPTLNTKGAQSLAKIVGHPVRKPEIYEWIDNHEDEGGGEFFSKRRDDFFESRSSHRKAQSHPIKSRYNSGINSSASNKCRKQEDSNSLKKMPRVHSDSRLQAFTSKYNEMVNTSENKTKRNLFEDLNEQAHFVSLEVHSKVDNVVCNVAGIYDVGPDTQLAAEAMEDLAQASPFKPKRDVHQEFENVSKGFSRRSGLRSSASVKKHNDAIPISDTGGVKTRSRKENMLLVKKSEEIISRNSSREIEKSLGAKLHNIEAHVARRTRNSRAMKVLGAVVISSNTKNVNCVTGESILLSGVSDDKIKAEISRQPKSNRRGSNAACQVVSELDSVDNTEMRDMELLKKEFNSGSVMGHLFNCPKRRRTQQRNLCNRSIDLNMQNSLIPSTNEKNNNITEIIPKILTAKRKRTRSVTQKLPFITENICLNAPNVRIESPLSKVCSTDVDNASSSVFMHNSDHSRLLEPPSQLKGSLCHFNDGNKLDLSPLGCKTLSKEVNALSPVCAAGDFLASDNKGPRSASVRELIRLESSVLASLPNLKDLRRKKDMARACVLFSNHLDEDIVRQQKKILGRLGIQIASTMSDATHFIADRFARTRNMLEAIALGKPVVTHMWLKSCGQASCFIDETKYILRDHKKEKEIGFSMPVSLARASRCPLLQGRRVLITPNVKPTHELIASLVKAAHGQPFERTGRSSMKDGKIPDDLLILSCEEDFTICKPLIERGGEAFNSELLLNGIVIQKLEYDRHRLFTDRVKRTRSTIWLRPDEGSSFLAVNKCT